MRIVWAGAKPSLRLASCCRVEVVKGACGLRRAGLASTGETVKFGALISLRKPPPPTPGADVEPLDLLAVGADQPGLERFAAWRRKRCHQRPIFPRQELFDLEFAVANQPQRDRLHPAC